MSATFYEARAGIWSGELSSPLRKLWVAGFDRGPVKLFVHTLQSCRARALLIHQRRLKLAEG